MCCVLMSVTSFVPQPVQAGIFKCTNQQGAVFYNDKPCPVKDKEKVLRSVKDPKSVYIPKPLKIEANDVNKKESNNAVKGVVIGRESKATESKSKDKENLANANVKKDMKSKEADVSNKQKTVSSLPSSSEKTQLSMNKKSSTKVNSGGVDTRLPGRIH